MRGHKASAAVKYQSVRSDWRVARDLAERSEELHKLIVDSEWWGVTVEGSDALQLVDKDGRVDVKRVMYLFAESMANEADRLRGQMVGYACQMDAS